MADQRWPWHELMDESERMQAILRWQLSQRALRLPRRKGAPNAD